MRSGCSGFVFNWRRFFWRGWEGWFCQGTDGGKQGIVWVEDESVPNGDSGEGNGEDKKDLGEVAKVAPKAAVGQRVYVGEEANGRPGEGPGRAL